MIIIGDFCLEKLDINSKHSALISGMAEDKKIKDYIDNKFKDWLSKYESDSEEKIEPCKMYVIREIETAREIGVVGSTSFEDGILNVVYAIKRNVRGRGYGFRVLEEITMYYLENIKGIKSIKLEIHESNKASRGCANRISYVKSEDSNEKGLEEWYYYNTDEKGRSK